MQMAPMEISASRVPEKTELDHTADSYRNRNNWLREHSQMWKLNIELGQRTKW